MIESMIANSLVRSKQEIILEDYSGMKLMEFLSSFSTPSILGSVTFVNDSTSPGEEVVTFSNGGRIMIAGSAGDSSPFAIKDGESFILQAWVKSNNTDTMMLYNDLYNPSGLSTIQFICNNHYSRMSMASLDIKHVINGSSDFGQTRYRIGIGKLLPVNQWNLISYECDSVTLKGYVNGVLEGEYAWRGAIRTENRDFVIGSTTDGTMTMNGSLSGFRFLKWVE